MRLAGNRIFLTLASVVVAANRRDAMELGIDVFASNGYALLKNKRFPPVALAAVRSPIYMNSQHLTGFSFGEYHSAPVGGSHLRIGAAPPGKFDCVNIYALAEMNRQWPRNLPANTKCGKRKMFFKCYGGSSIASQIARGIGPSAIAANWTAKVARFKGESSQYLLC